MGSKLPVLGRNRGVADTLETGWVYSQYALTATESQTARKRLASSRVEPSRVGPKSDGGFWTRIGRWLAGS